MVDQPIGRVATCGSEYCRKRASYTYNYSLCGCVFVRVYYGVIYHN